ncbi:MAG: VOC family protein [Bacteroidota bacterium]
MKKPIISGIQQIGIGCTDVHACFKWYRQHLGTDIPVFDEAAEAGLMLPYTGGVPRKRHAILAINIQGGGGLEIWQYTSRQGQGPAFVPQLGDTGIHIAKFKSKSVSTTYHFFQEQGVELLGPIRQMPQGGGQHFYARDPYGNLCEIVPSNHWFRNSKASTGGVYGGVIGVTDIDKARVVYSEILGYNEVVYDLSGHFEDLQDLPGGQHRFRRVLLRHSQERKGAFSRLLGQSELELIQVLDRPSRQIFADRMWGDLGFIHLCFDIQGMAEMKALCTAKGHPFTVDSSESFDMGEAAGHFSYIEDPDGTLIEFVETHKVPILKKINWYLDLRKRNPQKPLPNWMVRALAFNRVKD